MDQRTVQRIEQWPSRGFSGGFAELRGLADESFSGVVRAAGACLFMLNGRVIGVFDGRMEGFEDADGTVFEAPDPAPVLVMAMRETGGDQRGKYYTEDTPLTEVDDMLSGGGFTGFVELSENVLSGDYYVAYYGGKSMSAAFVGASDDLVTGDEAFERAADEVGIFEVTEVDLDVEDVPEPADDGEDAAATGAGATTGAAADEPADDEPEADEPADEEPASPEPPVEEAEPAEPSGGATPDDSASEPEPTPDSAADSEPATEPASAGAEPEPAPRETDASAEPGGDAADAAAADPTTADAASSEPSPDRTERPGGDPAAGRGDAAAERPASGSASDAGEQRERVEGPATPEGASDDVFSEEEQWRETTTVPALDPDESAPPEPPESTGGGSAAGASAAGSATAAKRERDAPASQRRSNAGQSSGGARQSQSSSGGRSGSGARQSRQARERVEKLEAAVAERDERIEELESELAAAQAERDDLREERDRLESELESVRQDLAAARERAERAGAGGGEHALSPADALAGTNLFVRYDSKGEPTLDAVADGAEADAVNANLRVEHHTTFDASDATVDGEPFESFLHDTLEYEFVSWLVRRLPYEIRDAGHQTGLADLYRVVPDIDRAELDGVVEVEDEEGTTSQSFDVVCRDKRGRPLVVAELNANREPVVEERMTGLVESATAVAGGVDSLGAGFYVTESFFKPDALSAASEASEGGLLSRDKRESFVKVGRKTGYHLCLVEARGGSFHVSIPEL